MPQCVAPHFVELEVYEDYLKVGHIFGRTYFLLGHLPTVKFNITLISKIKTVKTDSKRNSLYKEAEILGPIFETKSMFSKIVHLAKDKPAIFFLEGRPPFPCIHALMSGEKEGSDFSIILKRVLW